MPSFKTLRNISIGVLLVSGPVGWWGYDTIFGTNTAHESAQEVYVPTGSAMADVIGALTKAGVLKDTGSFGRVAGWMKYETPKPGRYMIAPDLSNRELISQLRSGRQEAVRVTFSTARKIEDIAGQASKFIEADSVAILAALVDKEHLSTRGLDLETAITQIIPNTYEMYWTTSPRAFVERINKETEKYWSQPKRKKLLKASGRSRQEVMTLASIVEKESQQKEERPRIAGVYLNRLKRGIKLQADPTVVFGVGDFGIRRVLLKHLQYDSPYNTYMYAGLPPGPICMPSVSSIDAVLEAEDHDYLFFCAKPGYSGSHAFAKTNAQHARNARVYHNWLNKQGIKG